VPTTAAANDQEIRAYMMTAAKTGAPYSGLRFTVERMADSAHGNEGTINLRLRLPPSSIVPEPGKKTVSYEMAAVALSERGEAANAVHVTPLNLTAEQTQEARVKGWQIEEPWPATPTVTAVRYVIRDNGSGRIGSVTVPLLPRAK